MTGSPCLHYICIMHVWRHLTESVYKIPFLYITSVRHVNGFSAVPGCAVFELELVAHEVFTAQILLYFYLKEPTNLHAVTTSALDLAVPVEVTTGHLGSWYSLLLINSFIHASRTFVGLLYHLPFAGSGGSDMLEYVTRTVTSPTHKGTRASHIRLDIVGFFRRQVQPGQSGSTTAIRNTCGFHKLLQL